MNSLPTWKLIAASLEQNIPVMLLYVVESIGSSPGRKGFSMAVNAGGQMEGSLGGGIMEHKFVEMARSRLNGRVAEVSVHRQVHDKNATAHQSGMICSGEQTIVLYTVKKTDTIAVNAIINCLEQNKTGLLELSPAGIRLNTIANHISNTGFKVECPDVWNYQQLIGYRHHLHIIGAGHCALALSRIMRIMDFYIHLYDDRPNLKTMEENNYVHEKIILNSYKQVEELVEPGAGTYVVIMTMGYRTDTIALDALINKDFTYTGLLGSKAKTEKVFQDMRAKGVEEKLIERIHAPVGLSINSQTPEEVAISIAAEIIKVKNSR